ncbi:MAG: amino acid permease [Candidatus Delongbacteria bacterium]|nr:amino acid permease [Candidatus Delongbacteria bacterium]
MISSGLFILPGLAYVQAGPGMILAYMLAGLLAATGMLSQSELISAMPKAGGTYFFVARSMGPGVGTIDGLIEWFSISLKSAFALIGMAAFTRLIIDVDIHVIAVLFCLIFLALNIIGAKETGRFQIVIVFVLIGLLIFYIFDGLIHIDVNNFTPFAPKGSVSIFSTAGLVFVSYGGLLKIGSISEETKNPTRNLPLGMILSFVVVGILYALVVFVTTGVLGNELGTTVENASLTPITDGAAVFMGDLGVIALTIAAILAFVSTANAGVLSASRYPLALSRDKLIPSFFGKLSKRSKTPYISILFTGAFIMLSFMLKLDILVKAASTVIIFTYIFSCLAVIILRESRVQNYQPKFKSPLYPWVQIIGIGGFLILVYEMGLEAILVSLGLGFLGFLTYWFYGKKKTESEYALLHLIERITNKQFLTGELESELKDIIRERDDIVKDRFDNLVEDRCVLDIEQKVNKEELFKIIAKKVSEKLDITDQTIYDLLTAREAESSTALTEFLAIPHIIIEGEKTFEMLIIRAKKGIELSEDHKDIKAIFVLLGTKDERNFHLRVISAIAQIVRDPDFEKRWMDAKNPENLRDVILLGKRVRM